MTKDSKLSRSTDSGVSENAQTGATEIRKLAEQASEAILNDGGFGFRSGQYKYCPSQAAETIAKIFEPECSRLASRVEELRESLRGLAVVSEIVRGSGGLDEQAWCKLCNTREQYIELADIIHKPDCALAQPSGNTPGKEK